MDLNIAFLFSENLQMPSYNFNEQSPRRQLKIKIKKNISCRPPKCANCFVFCRPPNWFLSWSKINKFLFWVSLHFYLLKKWVTTVKQFCTTCQNVFSQKSFHPNVDWSDIWQNQYPVSPQDSRMYYKINVRVNALGNKIVKI